jgi:hypothetical protein
MSPSSTWTTPRSSAAGERLLGRTETGAEQGGNQELMRELVEQRVPCRVSGVAHRAPALWAASSADCSDCW